MLTRAAELGFLGQPDPAPHLAHARGFAGALRATGPDPSRLADLGSGAGLPGLVLADEFSRAEVLLVEVAVRRAEFLRWAVLELGWEGRVAVDHRRAEEVGRDPALRSGLDAVVARSFGPPAVTAECAAPLLRVGGRLVVSEPPDSGADGRWPAEGLEEFGLGPARPWSGPAAYVVMIQDSPCPDRFPRRVGVPAKRPVF